MKRNIFYKILAIAVTAVFIGAFINAFTIQQKEERRMKNQIELTAKFLLGQVSTETDYETFVEKFANSYAGMRLTILDETGYIIADSISPLPKDRDHSQRPEFLQAKQKGKGEETRMSLSQNQQVYYLCYRGRDVYLRVSTTMESINVFFYQNLPALLVGVLAAVIFSWLASIGQAKEMIRPLDPIIEKMDKIGQGNYKGKIKMPEFEELIPLAATVNMLSDNVEDNVEALAKEKNKMSFILENMNQGLILLDGNHTVMTINPRALQILGFEEEVIPQELEKITQNEKVLDAAREIREGKEETEFDMEYHCIKHNVQFFHVTASRVYSSEPQQNEEMAPRKPGILFLFSNVTAQRNLVQMRQEFFENASHELKTPITSISGFAELLTSGMVVDKDKEQEYLNRILVSAKEMASLVDDILKIASLEEETPLDQDKTIDFEKEVVEVLRALQPQLNSKNISVSVNSQPILVHMTRAHSRDIITNLLSNAVKYNKQDGSITVVLKKEKDNLVFSVQDTGIGIAKDQQQRVFERFYQVEKSRNKFGSSGLGLSIAKHIVSYYGGTITIEGDLGKGTTFIVTLPITAKKDT